MNCLRWAAFGTISCITVAVAGASGCSNADNGSPEEDASSPDGSALDSGVDAQHPVDSGFDVSEGEPAVDAAIEAGEPRCSYPDAGPFAYAIGDQGWDSRTHNQICQRLGGQSVDDVWALCGPTLFHHMGYLTEEIPIVDPNSVVSGLFVGFEGDIWVGRGGIGIPTMDHWSGTHWEQPGTTLGNNPADQLEAFAMSSSSDMWAILAGGRSFHFDGTVWRPYDFPGGDVSLQGLWVAPNGSAFALGGGGSIVYAWDPNSSAWSLQYDPSADPDSKASAPFHLVSIFGADAGEVWAVGTAASGVVALHFNGTSWADATPVMLSFLDVHALNAVWVGNASNVWLAGDQGMVVRYDGYTWKQFGTPTIFDDTAPGIPGNSVLSAIWGVCGNDIWVAGKTADNQGIAYHYNY